MRRALALAALLLITACTEQPEGEALVVAKLDGSDAEDQAPAPSAAATAPAGPSACKAVTFENIPLTHCTADPAQHAIQMANLGGDKQPFGSLSAFAASVDPATIAFAVNGGMYGDDLKPIGYFVQNGERLKELNRAEGDGNFYMKPTIST